MMAARSEFPRGTGSRPPAVQPVLSPDELVGLLRTLGRIRSAGGAGIADLADAVPLDDERLLALVRTLDALGLVELTRGRVRVTVMGRRFAQAHEDERKQIFGERLRSRMPLTTYLLGALQAQPDRRILLALLERELRDEFAVEDAEALLRQIIPWGRYAGLFFYDDRTGVISIDRPDVSTN
jgi:NitT/TauT family transport system ATP-binding protein